jgi:hypothetical protein
MSKKLIITKSGYDALTNTNPDNEVFNSDYDTLKYNTSGYVDLVVSGSNAETSIVHGLGYVPFFTCYVNGFTPSGNEYHMTPGLFAGFGVYATAQSYADSNRLYFRVETNSATFTFRFYYKVFINDTGL